MALSESPVDRPAPARARRILVSALVLGIAFEVVNGIGTQDRSVFAATPWHDDPAHAIVLAAMFTVGLLTVALGARLLAWTAPGAGDRAQQMLRAIGVLVAAIGIACGFQWVSVAAGWRARSWDAATALQVAALGAITAVSLGIGAALLLVRAERRACWTTDWLGDAALLFGRVAGHDRAGTADDAVAWIRRRAILVFATMSVAVAAPVVAAQSLGEQWTDPVLIVWALVVLTATIFAFTVIANALAGFISRPPRSHGRRIAEASLVSGCLAIQVSEAFHDQIWRALTGHPAGTVSALVALTVGSGMVGSAGFAAVAALSGGSAAER